MKREEISAIFPDATKEQIDKLMALNGADITKAKGELADVQSQLKTAQDELAKAQEAGAKLEEAQKTAVALQVELDGMKHTEAVRLMREKVSGETKVPASLLTGETEEDCKAQAEQILAFAQPSGYPSVYDGGEPNNTTKPSTAKQFSDWLGDF